MGAWEGEWTSEPTGHSGPLWCLIEPLEGSDSHYHFRYRAGWAWIVRGEYAHDVLTREVGDAIHFDEEMDLGRLGGIYRAESKIQAGQWEGRHRSTMGDRGSIRMRRAAKSSRL